MTRRSARKVNVTCLRHFFLFAALVLSTAFASVSQGQTSWTDPVTTTPSFIQKSFGPYGSHLPGNGEEYCGPTSLAMELYWVGANGFSQIAPSSYDPANPDDVAAAQNLISVLGGLAGTSATGGTDVDDLATAIQTYFSAKGIGPSQFSYLITGTATADWFNQRLAQNQVANPTGITFTNLLVGWYEATGSSTNYLRGGGHFVDVAAATTGGTAALTTFNPYPSSFDASVRNIPQSNPQTVAVTTVPNDWSVQFLAPPSDQYQQIQSGTTLGDNSTKKGILQYGQSWTVLTSALPGSAGYAITPWQINSTQTIDTNSGSLSVIAALTGSGGLYKTGLGTLSLQSTNSLTGNEYVDAGVLQSTATSGTPFGTGVMTGSDSAVLEFKPDDTAPANISLSLASGSDSTLNVDNGGLIIRLTKGNNTSLTVTIGGDTDGETANIKREQFADLEIAPDAGLAALGNSTRVLVSGSDGNLPAVTNGMAAPWIVGRDSDAAQSGAFLDYISGTGFTLADTTKSSEVNINDPGVGDTTIYQADTNVAVGPSPVSVYALEVGAFTVSGTSTVTLGSEDAGSFAGVILNGGTISAPTAFGQDEAMIYTSLDGGSITSTISGSGGLVKFGPGALTLAANNGSSLSGAVSINSGMLIATGSAATGSGTVYVQSLATLKVNAGGSVAGEVRTSNDAKVSLNGGRIDGAVNILAPSGVQGGAILEGSGTIAGAATVGGTIQAGPVTGIIDFSGSADLTGASFYWQLNSLKDNSDGIMGEQWNGLSFSGPSAIIGTEDSRITLYVDVSLVDGPDSGDAFWDTTHTWTLFTINTMTTSWSGWVKGGNFSFDDGTFNFVWLNDAGLGDLMYTPLNPVPEASSCLLLMSGLGVIFLVRFARRRLS